MTGPEKQLYRRRDIHRHCHCRYYEETGKQLKNKIESKGGFRYVSLEFIFPFFLV